MSYLRTASEHAAYCRVFYRDTESYVNKLDNRDPKNLEATERALTGRRASWVSRHKRIAEVTRGDGNGRTQRFWLRMLAENAGFDFALSAADAKRWNDASRLGFVKGDHAAMERLSR